MKRVGSHLEAPSFDPFCCKMRDWRESVLVCFLPQELVNEQTRMKYERIKEQISMMLKIFRGLLDIADNMEARSIAMQKDMREFSKELV